jgi:hypothetical protein
MQQSCPYGSVRGAAGDRRPYRDKRLHGLLEARRDSVNLDPWSWGAPAVPDCISSSRPASSYEQIVR